MPSHPELPLVLTLPGLGNSGPGHWQTRWEAIHPHCRRIELGLWDRPHRNAWVNQLSIALRRETGPVLLAAHSLGCHAVTAWAAMEPDAASLVAGALLVAPPEVDFFPLDPRVSAFSPTASVPLPFPALLVASRNDPYCGQPAARVLARMWRAQFLDAGALGHINAESGLGDWDEGWRWLSQLADGRPAPVAGAQATATAR
ncbi:RBBP9/YdeN family alpha/beta hydrolase [Novosphingobium humi]|uniref:RBBP9/YdeN family alpha/beta hydrolase n=1 Tax=Novosphingobium humi TaxID=2282397 RepID=UPI0025AF787D|nr:alpha/beta hydrolase [Novosphingobium humi]WJT00367.1 alpha/beta hydrolase [Novosphingobium humi]